MNPTANDIIKSKYLPYVAFCTLVFITYGQSVTFGLVENDFALLSPLSQYNFWHTTNYWRPIYTLWMSILYSLFGLNSFPMHFLSLTLHMINGCLAYFILIRIGTRPPRCISNRMHVVSFGWKRLCDRMAQWIQRSDCDVVSSICYNRVDLHVQDGSTYACPFRIGFFVLIYFPLDQRGEPPLGSRDDPVGCVKIQSLPTDEKPADQEAIHTPASALLLDGIRPNQIYNPGPSCGVEPKRLRFHREPIERKHHLYNCHRQDYPLHRRRG